MTDNLNEFTLDIIDLQLLDALQKDASVSNQALADKVHVSPPTCLRRIKRLREIGIVAAEVAILSPDVLARVQGFGLHALVEVSLDRQGAEELDAFEAAVSGWPEVVQCATITGREDYVLRIVTSDMHAFDQFLREKLLTLGIVSDCESHIVTRGVKNVTTLPLGIITPHIR